MKAANLEFINRSGALIVCVKSDADEQTFTMMLSMLKTTLDTPSAQTPAAIVIDFENNSQLANRWGTLKPLLTQMRQVRVYLIQVPKELQAELTQGVPATVLKSLDDVLQNLHSSRPHTKDLQEEGKEFEDHLIEAFTASAVKTMEVQCSVPTKAQGAYIKDSRNRINYDIAATMGLMGRAVSGSVALAFQEKAFLGIMSKMLGETYDSVTTDVEDGCGELLNIMFGQAKRLLNEKGYLFGKTLPTIFIGHSLRVRQLAPNPTIMLPFETSEGLFYMELGYRRTSGHGA